MYTVSIMSFKGGVGKTTTAVNLASAAYERNARVLLVELDGQGNASRYLTRNKFAMGTPGWLMNQQRFEDVVVRTRGEEGDGPCIDLIPGEESMMEMVELWLTTNAATKHLLRLLTGLEGYDIAIIDTAPSPGGRAKNAILASDVVLVPFSAEPMAFEGPDGVLREIERMEREEERHFDTLLLPTMYDRSNGSPSPGLVSAMEKRFGKHPDGMVLPGISFSKRIKRSSAHGKTMSEFTPGHETCLQYEHVLDILVEKSYA